jgi:hypothetical protein
VLVTLLRRETPFLPGRVAVFVSEPSDVPWVQGFFAGAAGTPSGVPTEVSRHYSEALADARYLSLVSRFRASGWTVDTSVVVHCRPPGEAWRTGSEGWAETMLRGVLGPGTGRVAA